MSMRWYIVHAYSNFEKKVADSIREQAHQRGLADKFQEILVPTEQVVEVRRGRKINSERKFFPGYVLVKCDLTDEVYHLIKNTPKVTGFLGADKKPMPISDPEADRIKGQVAEGVERPKAAIRFEIGENVRVADGPFASFNGVGRGSRRIPLARQGRGVDLRPRHPGRPRIRPGREGLIRKPSLARRNIRHARAEKKRWRRTMSPSSPYRNREELAHACHSSKRVGKFRQASPPRRRLSSTAARFSPASARPALSSPARPGAGGRGRSFGRALSGQAQPAIHARPAVTRREIQPQLQ